jgi:mRNA interferase YafQ
LLNTPAAFAVTTRRKSGRLSKRLDTLVLETVTMLAKGEPLSHRCFGYPRSGEWNDYRDCHIRPCLILNFRKPDAATLELIRFGSHSEPSG